MAEEEFTYQFTEQGNTVSFILGMYHLTEAYKDKIDILPVSRGGDAWEQLTRTNSFNQLMAERPVFCFGEYGSGKSSISRLAQQECSNVDESTGTLVVRLDGLALSYVMKNDRESGRQRLRELTNQGIASALMIYSLDLLTVMKADKSRIRNLDQGQLEQTIFDLANFLQWNQAGLKMQLQTYIDIGKISDIRDEAGVHPLALAHLIADKQYRQMAVDKLLETLDRLDVNDGNRGINDWLAIIGKEKLWLHFDSLDGGNAENVPQQAEMAEDMLKIGKDLAGDNGQVTIFALSQIQKYLQIGNEKAMTIEYTREDLVEMMTRYVELLLGSLNGLTPPEAQLFQRHLLESEDAFKQFIKIAMELQLTPRMFWDFFKRMCHLKFNVNHNLPINKE